MQQEWPWIFDLPASDGRISGVCTMQSLYFAKDQAKDFMHTSQALFQLNSFSGPSKILLSFARDQFSRGTSSAGTGSEIGGWKVGEWQTDIRSKEVYLNASSLGMRLIFYKEKKCLTVSIVSLCDTDYF